MLHKISLPRRLFVRRWSFLGTPFVIVFLLSLFHVTQAQSTLTFNDPSPLLETGSPLAQGARYRFRNVAPNTDALVTITTINNANLLSIDSVLGFANRFEPTIRVTGVNQQGYVRFDFEIVDAGTSVPRIVPAVYISAQDIDGNGDVNQIREWVEFVNTGTVSTGSPTLLTAGTPVAGGARYNQQDSNNNQAGVGTDNRYEMYTTVLGNSTTFTIIGGNLTGSAGCSGLSCDRQNSYAFDPTSSNQTPINPDVSITKSGPASVTVGDSVNYSIVSSNLGPATAHGAIVNDVVPAGLSGVTISCVAASGAVCPSTAGLSTLSNVFIPTFPVGGTVTFSISGNTSAAGTLVNTATIDPPNGSTDPNTANNSSAAVTTTVNNPPNIVLVKNCTVPANCTTAPQLPDVELTYSIDYSNTGGTSASNLSLVDVIPNDTDFKLGSVAVNTGTTGLSFAIEYSDDFDIGNPSIATWVYTPITGGGGAAPGFDRNVKAVRWRVTSGSLPNASPNNAGDVSFVVKIR